MDNFEQKVLEAIAVCAEVVKTNQAILNKLVDISTRNSSIIETQLSKIEAILEVTRKITETSKEGGDSTRELSRDLILVKEALKKIVSESEEISDNNKEFKQFFNDIGQDVGRCVSIIQGLETRIG